MFYLTNKNYIYPHKAPLAIRPLDKEARLSLYDEEDKEGNEELRP